MFSPLLLIAFLLFCIPLSARSLSIDRLLGSYISEKKTAASVINYFGLRFAIDDARLSCLTGNDGQLSCKTNQGADITLAKLKIPSRKSLRLLRQNRKAGWMKKYSGLNNYVEQPIKILGKSIILQQAVYFRFDNINWRVLLRSFDVVMDDKTIINVTTACDVRLWPANIEIIENIERSFAN